MGDVQILLHYISLIANSHSMSSSQECTYGIICNCHQAGLSKRPYNLCVACNNLRQHAGKRRFPPRKKQQAMKMRSNKGKHYTRKGGDLGSFLHEENRNQAETPTKNLRGDVNPISKLNTNTTFGIEAPYHAVGHSQREKLMGVSPSPEAHTNFQVENKGGPFTDRDRRIFSGNNLRSNIAANMRKTKNIAVLDQNFLQNFGNPENLTPALVQVVNSQPLMRQGSASVEKNC